MILYTTMPEDNTSNIQEIEDNVLDFPNGINVVVHGANCLATMKSGIAKQIRDRYPQAVAADKEYHARQKGLADLMMGTFSIATVGEATVDAQGVEVLKAPSIINLYQQRTNRTVAPEITRHIDYEAFYRGLELIHRQIPIGYHLGFPGRIGCGRAGGDWKVVHNMIYSVFEGTERKVTIAYLPQAPKPE